MIISVFWIICLFIWFVLWIFYWIYLSSKKIKKLTNIIKKQKDSIMKWYQSYFDKWCKNRSDEYDRLYSENKYLYNQNCELRHKLSDFYKSDEFIKINWKLKKYKKKIKKMYKLLPYYNNFVNTFTLIKDKF